MARIKRDGTKILSRVESLLLQAFPPPDQVSLEDDNGIIGVVTAGRFRGLDGMDRQDMIWEVLDAHLTPAQKRHVVTIAGVTPEEQKAILPLD